MAAKLFNVYFGGTFDPPHRGHFDILNALVRDEWVHQVFVTPTHLNPLKSLSTAEAARGDGGQRLKWVSLWLEESRRVQPALAQKIQLNLNELQKGERHPDQPSYTVDSLAELVREQDAALGFRWSLAIGSDSLVHLEKWKDIDSLLEGLDGVWLFARGPTDRPMQKIPLRLRPLCEWRLFAQPVFDVASSDLRRQLESGQPIPDSAVLPSVRNALKLT